MGKTSQEEMEVMMTTICNSTTDLAPTNNQLNGTKYQFEPSTLSRASSPKKYSYVDYQIKTLNPKELKFLSPAFELADWFTRKYQSKVNKANPEYCSIRDLLQAVENTNQNFKQYSVDERNVTAIAKDLFINSRWLKRNISVATYDDNLYIIGGRHRLLAIVNTFATFVTSSFRQEKLELNLKEHFFELALKQKIACDITKITDFEDLLVLIQSDNQSRKMDKVEEGHLKLQLLGGDANTTNVGDIVLNNELSPKESVELAAQSFARRSGSKLKSITRQQIGEKVSRFILFGGSGKEHKQIKVKSIEEFNYKMDAAWEILLKKASEEIILGRNATSLAKAVIEELKQREILPENQPMGN